MYIFVKTFVLCLKMIKNLMSLQYSGYKNIYFDQFVPFNIYHVTQTQIGVVSFVRSCMLIVL